MKRTSTPTSSSRRRAPRPSLESPTLRPSTSSRSRVHREGFSYHWIFRSNIPKRRSLLLTNDIQKRNFFGMGEVFGVLVNVRVFIRSEMSRRPPHAPRPAWTNPQIANRGQVVTGTDSQRADGSKGASTDQTDPHLFPSPAFYILPSANRGQGNREHPHGSAELDCRFWRQFDRQGMVDIYCISEQILISRHLWATPDCDFTTCALKSPLSCSSFRPSDRWFCRFGRSTLEPMVSEKAPGKIGF